MEVGSSTEMGAPGASHLGTGDRGPKTDRSRPRSVPVNASALSEARFHESVKLGEVLCARSIEPFEGGRWRLRWMRAIGWTRSNGYGN